MPCHETWTKGEETKDMFRRWQIDIYFDSGEQDEELRFGRRKGLQTIRKYARNLNWRNLIAIWTEFVAESNGMQWEISRETEQVTWDLFLLVLNSL